MIVQLYIYFDRYPKLAKPFPSIGSSDLFFKRQCLAQGLHRSSLYLGHSQLCFHHYVVRDITATASVLKL